MLRRASSLILLSLIAAGCASTTNKGEPRDAQEYALTFKGGPAGDKSASTQVVVNGSHQAISIEFRIFDVAGKPLPAVKCEVEDLYDGGWLTAYTGTGGTALITALVVGQVKVSDTPVSPQYDRDRPAWRRVVHTIGAGAGRSIDPVIELD